METKIIPSTATRTHLLATNLKMTMMIWKIIMTTTKAPKVVSLMVMMTVMASITDKKWDKSRSKVCSRKDKVKEDEVNMANSCTMEGVETDTTVEAEEATEGATEGVEEIETEVEQAEQVEEAEEEEE
jgi:hypothetical protein